MFCAMWLHAARQKMYSRWTAPTVTILHYKSVFDAKLHFLDFFDNYANFQCINNTVANLQHGNRNTWGTYSYVHCALYLPMWFFPLMSHDIVAVHLLICNLSLRQFKIFGLPNRQGGKHNTVMENDCVKIEQVEIWKTSSLNYNVKSSQRLLWNWMFTTTCGSLHRNAMHNCCYCCNDACMQGHFTCTMPVI